MLIRYGFPRAWQSLKRNKRATFNSILILTASLAVLGMIALLYRNVDHYSRLWLSNTSVSLFLAPGVDAEGRAAILDKVRRHPLVKSAAMIAPKEGLNALAERLGAEYSLFAGIEPDTLPYVIDFEVLLDFRSRLEDIARGFRAIPGVEEAVYAERVLDKVNLFFTVMRGIGLFFVALLGAAFYLTVSHAARLSLHARREEIEILDLVGATRTVIRSAFVVESVLIALGGFLLALAVTAGCYALAVRGLAFNPLTQTLQGQAVFLPALGVAGTGLAVLLLAALSSFLAVNRMLKDLEP
jgi:cell division transport system permease protein